MIRKTFLQAAFAALFVSLLLAAFAGEGGRKGQTPTGENVSNYGRIDYEKGMMYATGQGVISTTEPNDAKAYLRARGYARLDALRNLLMTIDHVRVDATMSGKDFEADETITAEVHGIVRGAQIVSERQVPIGKDMMVELTVSVPMYGRQSVASVFLPEIAKHNQEVLQGGAAPPVITPEIVAPAHAHQAPHSLLPGNNRVTSLIIDARGLKIDRSMAPKIRREDGSEVWGSVNANEDFVIEHGIVVYAHSMDEALQDKRAGSNPLIVDAVGRAGGKFNSDAVLTSADADAVMSLEAKEKFLDKFRVIFIVDENH